jgi:hypothetical protein
MWRLGHRPEHGGEFVLPDDRERACHHIWSRLPGPEQCKCGFNDRRFIRLSICQAMKMEPSLSQDLMCFTFADCGVRVLFNEPFPSRHPIVKNSIIWNRSVDRNLATGKRWRFEYLLEVQHKRINSGELNIRPVKITFTGFNQLSVKISDLSP